MSLSTRYSPQDTEKQWYDHWISQNYFHSEPDERESFTIVIPPPNVTGRLHMGHLLNNTIQDILIRRARMQGKNACWVPGMDHASIATEAKVVKALREKGLTKGEMSREEFLQHAWKWKEEYGGIILTQLQRLGASCDWERTRFTLDEKYNEAVLQVFADLHSKGYIYRDLRMTNWDPDALTALSNEEVIYRDEQSHLYHLRYEIVDSEGDFLTIATQRPETIMADAAVAVHPEDERYKDLVGKMVRIPLIDREIPIIADSYVDIEFGTGALKITPAHDQNDYEVGKRHNLPVIDILTEDGKLNAAAQILIGEDRFEARKKIRQLLKEGDYLVELEQYTTSIGHSERTDAVVEPRLTKQWFIRMDEFAKVALKAVESGDVKFFPPHFYNMYNSWLREENVRDWCISRQLWWGQRIPAWYMGKGEDQQVFVAPTAEKMLEKARQQTGRTDLTLADFSQDEDVLDTWASSWIWPLAVFDGFHDQKELAYYYPTNVLVTGWDIMFFWVARMIISGYEYSEALLGKDFVEKNGRMPFKDVFFTGMVRDSHRRKMSKSLGNSPDSIELLDRYGADGVRFGLLSATAAGNDIVFDAPMDPETHQALSESKLCEQGRNFCNKMWNALRLIKGWETVDRPATSAEKLAEEWLQTKYLMTVRQVNEHLATYRLSDAVMALYRFIWDDFCSWYLEAIKPASGDGVPLEVMELTLKLYEKQMSLLHPFMPFITEEIWHQLRDRKAGEDCIVSTWPVAPQHIDESLIIDMEMVKKIVSGVREIRNSKGLKQREEFPLLVKSSTSAEKLLSRKGLRELIQTWAHVSGPDITAEEVTNAGSFISGKDQFFLVLPAGEIDVAAECDRLQKELEHQEGFLKSVMKKLDNERFVQNAPAPVVAKEQKKRADAEARIDNLQAELSRLGCH